MGLSMAQRTVKANGHKRTLFIPVDGTDKSYNDYLIASEIEKTTNDLNKLPTKRRTTSTNPEAVGVLKELNAWNKNRDAGRRIFGGITLGG